jgi:hypothetical protein
MPDSSYAFMRGRVALKLTQWSQGAIVLVRTDYAYGEVPWQPGAPTMTTYVLDAVAKGVSEKYVDNTSVFGSDIMVVVKPGTVEPRRDDLIGIDGAAHEIKQVVPRPAAGLPAAYVVIVAGAAARPLA